MSHRWVAAGLAIALIASSAGAVDWFKLPVVGGKAQKGEIEEATPVAAGSFDEGAAAQLLLLDKNTNRMQDFTLVAGRESTRLPLDVYLRRCVRDVQGVPGQDVAWIDVYEGDERTQVYSGWMFNFYPDVAALEHPRYEIRLLECARSAPLKQPQVRTAPNQPDEIVTPTETPPEASPEVPPQEATPQVEDGEVDPLHQLMDAVAEYKL